MILDTLRGRKLAGNDLQDRNCCKIAISLIMALRWALECNGLISPVKIFGPVTTLSDVGVEYSTLPTTSLNPATNYAAITRS